MKKAKLFMMLALLIMGVSNVWAGTRNYQVVYTGRTTSQGAGYTIKNTQLQNGTITSEAGAETLVTYREDGWWTNDPTALSTQNINNYITAAEVDDYDATITVTINSGYNPNPYGTITIAYSPKTVRYRVLYEMATLPGAGYTLTGTNPTNGQITSSADATVLEIQKTGTAQIQTLTTDNVSNFINANNIDGYTISYYVNLGEAQLGYLGNIYINYVSNSTTTPWTDGIWDYSTQYYRTTGTVVDLPSDECAISLHLTAKEETETVTFYRYRLTYRNQSSYYDLIDDNMNENGNANTYPLDDIGNARLNGTTTTIDDPNTEFGEDNTITYTYKSQGEWEQSNWYATDNNGNQYYYYRKAYTYERKRTIGVSTVENAEIPLVDPTYGRKVTAIQKWGLCYKQDDIVQVHNCNINNNGTVNKDSDGNPIVSATIDLVDDHSNLYLKTVTFEKNANGTSNLKSIGDYAFMSCKELTDVDIPNSVEYLGQGAFEMDTKLKNVNFQTLDDGTIKIKTIKNFTFWLCSAMETLYLPDGITEIEGQQSGASLQYMTSLINLRLPNTLQHIGPHFLCSAQSLRTLTIPNSVTYIDGASFHGCENLETVYILGPAATLQGEYAEGNSDTPSSTFSANTTCCAEAVNKCTFYTTDDNIEGYQNDPVWSRIDEGGPDNYDPDNGNFGNLLTTIPAEKRTLPTNWVTAIFPSNNEYAVEDYIETFGTGTLVAEMNACPSYSSQTIKGKTYRVYHLNFVCRTDGKIPANKPVLIKAGHQTEYEFYNDYDKQQDWWKNNSTEDFPYYVTAPDNAKIYMKGRYLGHQLDPGDFYFMYKNKTVNDDGSVTYPEEAAKFYQVPDQQNAAIIKACRCWWSVDQSNMRAKNVLAKPASQRFFDDETTGINALNTKVVIDGVYDMNGHKLDIKLEDLPQGLFIINGKKVIKK